MNNSDVLIKAVSTEQSMRGFAVLMGHVCRLYTFGESSSVSEYEGNQLAQSVLYVLGLRDDNAGQISEILASENVIDVWTTKRKALESRIGHVMNLWHEVVSIIPPVHNIALRDTLLSIKKLPRQYDTFFAAHEIPCSIDYPLSVPISEQLQGLDYVEAWLSQLLKEAQFLSLFEVQEIVSCLETWCPDYKGLLVNLFDPIFEAWKRGELVQGNLSNQTSVGFSA